MIYITKYNRDERNKIVDETVPVSSTKVAEMTKIMENIHRSVNIGLVFITILVLAFIGKPKVEFISQKFDVINSSEGIF